jgi:hypothetical protein
MSPNSAVANPCSRASRATVSQASIGGARSFSRATVAHRQHPSRVHRAAHADSVRLSRETRCRLCSMGARVQAPLNLGAEECGRGPRLTRHPRRREVPLSADLWRRLPRHPDRASDRDSHRPRTSVCLGMGVGAAALSSPRTRCARRCAQARRRAGGGPQGPRTLKSAGTAGVSSDHHGWVKARAESF